MNTHKNKILSLLLFVFTFFVVHDYVIEGFETSVEPTACIKAYDSKASCIVSDIDVYTQIHDNIHSMLQVHLDSNELFKMSLLKMPPSTYQLSSNSYVTPLPEKPPII